jgi:hypothetical protein
LGKFAGFIVATATKKIGFAMRQYALLARKRLIIRPCASTRDVVFD